MLRIGIVLQYQLDNCTREIPPDLIFQGTNDKAITEREIYRRAHEAAVVDGATFDRLQSLYDDRNRVIHRYIISRITTTDVLNIAISYEGIIITLSKRIHEIEREQIKRGVGITVCGPTLEGDEGRQFVEEMTNEKHMPTLAKLIRGI